MAGLTPRIRVQDCSFVGLKSTLTWISDEGVIVEGEKDTLLPAAPPSGSSLLKDRTFLFSMELNSSRCPDPPPPAVNEELVVSSVDRGREE